MNRAVKEHLAYVLGLVSMETMNILMRFHQEQNKENGEDSILDADIQDLLLDVTDALKEWAQKLEDERMKLLNEALRKGAAAWKEKEKLK